jgi:nucleotide-binding universal stress UspA family protein
MFERIIVTLDGSPSSEAALPAARELARRLGSSLVLLHVVETRPPKLVHGERHLASAAEAEAYLAALVASLEAEGIKARAHVHDGGRETEGSRAIAASVAAHEAEFGNDLAVMAAHGRHGLSDGLSGSLPLKVAASGGAGVLLAAADFKPLRILLPLDGRIEHEAAVPAALALAKAFGIGIRLVAVVPRSAAEAGGPGAAFARLAPALSGMSLEYAAEAEETYLAGVVGRIKAEGVAAEARVLRGKPAKAIAVSGEAGDLLVLSTHRKLGLDASLDGSVAFGVSRRWKGPMLIVPIAR